MKTNIHREIVIDAPIEMVWSAITTRQYLGEWYMRTSDFEPVVGNTFVFEDEPQGKWDGKVHGEVMHVESPKRLVYSFWGNQMSYKTIVEWSLDQVGGKTRVRVDHTGFEGLGGFVMRNIIAFGWRKFLKKLQQHEY